MEKMLLNLPLDWSSEKNLEAFNPRLSIEEKEQISRILLSAKTLFKGHLFLATSGSTGKAKVVALSKNAMQISASAVNKHLQVESDDSWLLALPLFHVGGLAIDLRAQLSGSKVCTLGDWNPKNFMELVAIEKVTLSSLVPAQIFDLVKNGFSAPPSLRALVVGGGALGSEVFLKARSLNWPLLPSYGLTESGSQVATAALQSLSHMSDALPALELLSHVEATISAKGLLCLKGGSLLTAYLTESGRGQILVTDPKVDSYFETEDRVEIFEDENASSRFLKIFGRGQDFVKILGENVDLLKLEALLEGLCLEVEGKFETALAPMPHERNGFEIHLVLAGEGASQRGSQIMSAFNQKVAPFERIQKFHVVQKIPRTASSKLQRGNLLAALSEN